MKETEIGSQIMAYFQAPDHDVYCEVPCAGIIDVVVKTGPVITAIECKTTFGLSVIEQAYKNRTYAHYSYVAVPKISNYFAEHLCAQFGIGILTVPVNEPRLDITERLRPRLNRRIIPPGLPEFCKHNQAGVQSDRWTAFSWFVADMKTQLGRFPDGLTHKELFERCIRHYSKPSSLKSCLQTYIRSGVISEVVYRNNRFYLSHEKI